MSYFLILQRGCYQKEEIGQCLGTRLPHWEHFVFHSVTEPADQVDEQMANS